ncbi:MAG: hypothetical protein ACLQT5_16330 [Steroidobacteraceae bacterium]
MLRAHGHTQLQKNSGCGGQGAQPQRQPKANQQQQTRQGHQRVHKHRGACDQQAEESRTVAPTREGSDDERFRQRAGGQPIFGIVKHVKRAISASGHDEQGNCEKCAIAVRKPARQQPRSGQKPNLEYNGERQCGVSKADQSDEICVEARKNRV